MDYGTSEQRRLLQESARNMLQDQIGALVEDCEQRYHPLPRDMAVDLFKRLKPLGYINSTIPSADGGEGLDYVSYGVLLEELARCWPSLALMVIVQEGQAHFLAERGTEEQKKKYLPSLLSGDIVACLGVTEPNVGSNLREMQMRATQEGSGHKLNGTKLWITNGTICDICLVLAYTEKGLGTKGMSLFLVDTHESPFIKTDIHKLGLRCSSTAELVFNDCYVPIDNRIGVEGEGYKLVTNLLSLARCCTAVVEVGIAQAAIDRSVHYARERTQFGKPIGRFQLIQELIADMVVDTEAARLLTYKALRLVGRASSYALESSTAKYYACEAAGRTTARAIEVHGAYGISVDSPTERLYRDARTLFPPDGPMSIQKLFIGAETLGMSAFV